MTNVYGTPEKFGRKSRLVQIGIKALEDAGWKVERVQGSGKSSLRRITKNGKSQLASIRTTQDTWIAFPRDRADESWVTLSEVDAVVAVSVDDRDNPRFANVHFLSGDEMRDRFDRAYAARRKAGHSIPVGRGIWISLYLQEDKAIPSLVGAGAGLASPPIATVPLASGDLPASVDSSEEADGSPEEESPLTISEAKRRLAKSLGVDPANIKITIET